MTLLLIEMQNVLILFLTLVLVYSFRKLLIFLSSVRSIQYVATKCKNSKADDILQSEITQDIVSSYPLAVHWAICCPEFQSYAQETTTFL